MIAKIKNVAFNILIRIFPSKMGYAIKHKGLGYFNAKTIIKQAKEAGKPIPEFLETTNQGGVGKRRDEIIKKLIQLDAMPTCQRIIEIGAGTGMYLEKFIETCKPTNYEVYETDVGWSKYLSDTYDKQTNLMVHNASGNTLQFSLDNSADMVVAHGVYVYIPVINTLEYLKESIRVCKQGGLIIFDCFTDRFFTLSQAILFREKNPYFDFPVITPHKMIEEFCETFHLKILDTFNSKYHSVEATYYILQKI